MTKKPKILVVNDYADCGASYYLPFQEFGECTGDHKLLDSDPDSIALVVFTGGADVSPHLYGEKKNKKTYCNEGRDYTEQRVFKRALELKKPIAGICRGAQFICAMSGGKLVQDINNHGRYHNIRTDDDRLIFVSSTHHQMQLPPKDAVPIAWAEPKLSDHYEGPDNEFYTLDREHDVVWYPTTNAIGMQYHPEMMGKDTPGFKYAAELIERFFKLPKIAA